MKKWLAVLIGLVAFSPVFAFDMAKLRVKITAPANDNRYFLCVTNAGCVSIQAGNKGKIYPMDSGTIANIVTTDIGRRMMHAEPLPATCNREIKKDQTLTISGKLSKATNNRFFISNLKCAVS